MIWKRDNCSKLFGKFEMKDIGKLKYYFGIEVTYTYQDIFISEKVCARSFARN